MRASKGFSVKKVYQFRDMGVVDFQLNVFWMILSPNKLVLSDKRCMGKFSISVIGRLGKLHWCMGVLACGGGDNSTGQRTLHVKLSRVLKFKS